MKASLLIEVLRNPYIINDFSAKEWNLLLRQAIASKMLVRVAENFHINNIEESIPKKIFNHINSEKIKVTHLHTQVNQEITFLNSVFEHLKIRAIYLKGTAYLLADIPVAHGRFFSDIDILLNKKDIKKVEVALKCRGWISQKTEDYDQEYYRKYMHEIPPMQNIMRGTIIDIHHNILPVCNTTKIDIGIVTKDHVSLKKNHLLAPPAMFLHSAIHLFHEGELEQGLRGLSDLDMIFNHYQENETNFCQKTIDLAKEINQQRSLYYTWRYLDKIFNRNLPEKAQLFMIEYKKKAKSSIVADFIFLNLLDVHHSTNMSWKFSIAVKVAYWRGHLLRMPLRLLIPHLLKKTYLQTVDFAKKNNSKTQRIDALNPRFKNLEDD